MNHIRFRRLKNFSDRLLGVAPHVADKIVNHQSGTISGVAAVYQRHEFMEERRDALDRWNAHVDRILNGAGGILLEAS